MTVTHNPVVIIPGVLFWDTLYDTMKEAIAVYIPQERVVVAPVSLVDWIGFPPSPERSTNRVMKVVDRTVRAMERKFPGEPITLVAHSGGWDGCDGLPAGTNVSRGCLPPRVVCWKADYSRDPFSYS